MNWEDFDHDENPWLETVVCFERTKHFNGYNDIWQACLRIIKAPRVISYDLLYKILSFQWHNPLDLYGKWFWPNFCIL